MPPLVCVGCSRRISGATCFGCVVESGRRSDESILDQLCARIADINRSRVIRLNVAVRMTIMTTSEGRQQLAEEVAKVTCTLEERAGDKESRIADELDRSVSLSTRVAACCLSAGFAASKVSSAAVAAESRVSKLRALETVARTTLNEANDEAEKMVSTLYQS